MKLKDAEACSIADVTGRFDGVDPTELETYLAAFAKPGGCPQCGEPDRFRWGLAHGSGTCACGWPGRAYHYIGPRKEGVYGGYQIILWYHPSGVTRKRR